MFRSAPFTLMRMVLGILSDTHSRLPSVEQALRRFEQEKVSLIIHCGDWHTPEAMRHLADLADMINIPVRGVLGNNDKETVSFQTLANDLASDFEIHEGVFELAVNGKSIAVYHGHHKPTKQRVLTDPKYDIVLLGHSHKPEIRHEPGKLIVNPGSTAFSIPRSKGWRPSIAFLNAGTQEARIEYI